MLIKHIVNAWNALSDQGTRNLPELSAKRTRLLNQACLVVALISTFFIFPWALQGNVFMVGMNIMMVLVHLGLIWLNRIGLYFIPKFLIFFVLSTSVFMAAGMLGKTSNLHFSLIPIAGFSVLLFDPKEKIKLFCSIAYPMILLVILIAFDFKLFPDLIGKTVTVLPAFEYLISIFVVLFTTFYLYRSNTKAHDNYQVLYEQHLEAQKLMDEERARAIYASKLAALGEMAAGIAHEVKSPLSLISMYAELMLKDAKAQKLTDDKITEYSGHIVKTVGRISGIVTAMNGITRNSDDHPLIPTEVKKIIEDAQYICKHRFHLGNIELTSSLPENLPLVLCRPADVGQVLVNLLNNAFDATSHLKNATVVITASLVENNVHVAVEDNGPGVPVEVRKKIFEHFFTTKAPGKGTGLGLSISKKIMASNNGDLFLDESSSRTRFVCVLKTK